MSAHQKSATEDGSGGTVHACCVHLESRLGHHRPHSIPFGNPVSIPLTSCEVFAVMCEQTSKLKPSH
ncbi:MAG: hypothetical protein ACPGXX_14755, partial [Planctomycetaceae bacterium]